MKDLIPRCKICFMPLISGACPRVQMHQPGKYRSPFHTPTSADAYRKAKNGE